MGAEAIAVLLAGLAAKHFANSEASDRANELQRAMETYQRARAQQNEAAIGKLVDAQTPEKRATDLAQTAASREQTMQSTIDAAHAASPVQAPAGASTGSDYQRASSAAADTVAARTKRAIEQLGIMGAPGEQALTSGIRYGRAAGNVDAGNNAIANVGSGYMRDINNVQPDPFLSLLGDVGIAYGGGTLGTAASAAATRRKRMNDSYGDGYSGGNTRYVDNTTDWQ
jgi:hypothetical protein